VNPDYYKTAGISAPQNGEKIAQPAAAALPAQPERKTSLAKVEALGGKYLALASSGAANVLAGGNR
jgi:hypothetical protein